MDRLSDAKHTFPYTSRDVIESILRELVPPSADVLPPAHAAVAAAARNVGRAFVDSPSSTRIEAGIALLDSTGLPHHETMRHVCNSLRERLIGTYVSIITMTSLLFGSFARSHHIG